MIPVSKPYISNKEVKYVNDALQSGWVSSLGPYIDQFESSFADYCGTRFAVSVSNGTVGLHLALVALGIGLGDEVIVPDLTFVATANAVKMAQATPVMIDVKRETYCIDPLQIEMAITSRTKAIIPVHLYGHPANMSAIQEIAKKHGLMIIEDAAEAHGAIIGGSRVGSMSDCGVFSFYGNKIITTGEGGIITTDREDVYHRLRYFRDHAMSKDVRYWHTDVGFNYRMTNIQAALGLAQLEQIDHFIDQRHDQLEQYRLLLEPYGVECNPVIDCKPVNWITCAVVNGLGRIRRDNIINRMRDRGVDARPFFFPITQLPMYANASNPVAIKLSEDGFNLPTFVGLNNDQISQVCKVFLACLDEVK